MTELSIEQALLQAIECHKAGRLQDAERLYRAILEAEPRHADANHNLGVLAVGVGRPDAALPLLRTALETAPEQRQFWLSFVEALLAAGMAQDAQTVLAQGRQRGISGKAVDALAKRIGEKLRVPADVSGSADPASGPSPNRRQRRAARSKNGPARHPAERGRAADKAAVNISDVYAQAIACHRNGQLSRAQELYRRILSVDDRRADCMHLLGVIAAQTGSLEPAIEWIGRAIEIDDGVAEFHFSLGDALKGQGKLDDAVARYQRALEIRPDLAEALYSLGHALQLQGRLDEAIERYEQALALRPAFPEALLNLGSALRQRGRLDAATARYEQALAIKPRFPEALSNLGNVLRDQGRLDEAIERYAQALAIEPTYADAHSNLGNALRDTGRLDEAIARYEQALAVKPEFPDALCNLGEALLARGEPERAMKISLRALQARESPESRALFCECLRRCRLENGFAGEIEAISDLAHRALAETWTRPKELAAPCLSLLGRNPALRSAMDLAMSSWPQRLPEQVVYDALDAVFDDPFLLCLLQSTPIPSIAFERLITGLRSNMIEIAARTPPAGTDRFLHAFCAVARQCFINEYVFALGPGELERAQAVRERLVSALAAGETVPVLPLVVVAAYFPLHTLPLAARLSQRDDPAAVRALLVQQIEEPAEELRIRETIPCLTPIDDSVSAAVRRQYEENPYPRWERAPPSVAFPSVEAFLRRAVPTACFRSIRKAGGFNVLIAGCGTGQHAVDTAQCFPGARVLAIDLSLASLAFAKRKTREMGLSNLDYAQADILQLERLHRRFDVVEAFGVLHHLADPMQGWRVLLGLVRPGGYMGIGLYSEFARRDIAEVRSFIAERGYGQGAEDIRRCRQELVASDTEGHWRDVTMSGDFFSTSECRDLLFHIQEHRLTLPQIARFLADNELAFIGFQTDARTLQAYRTMFPDDRSASDLGCWHQFEIRHPDTFRGMYQFWVRAPR